MRIFFRIKLSCRSNIFSLSLNVFLGLFVCISLYFLNHYSRYNSCLSLSLNVQLNHDRITFFNLLSLNES